MIIHIDNVTITGWVDNRSENVKDHDEFTIHAREFGMTGNLLNDYDSPVYESYAMMDEAEEMLLKKCYEIALNHLQVRNIPF